MVVAPLALLARLPFARSNWVHVLHVHGVNLFEGAIFGLDEEEEDDGHEHGTATGKDQAVQIIDGIGNEPGTAICQQQTCTRTTQDDGLQE